MGADGSANAPRCGRNRHPAGTGASRLRGQMSLAVRGSAPTQKQHKPGARAKINTGVTRTKRHSPAYGGTRSTMAVPENLASSPAEMRVSWADYPFPGRWAKGDRPSEKRKVGSSILPLTTTSDQLKRPDRDRGPGVLGCWGLSLGPRNKRTIGAYAGTGGVDRGQRPCSIVRPGGVAADGRELAGADRVIVHR